MKTSLLLSVLLVTAALAGCANDTDGDNDNMTTSPTTGTTTTPTPSTTPATPAVTPSTTPATTPDGEGGAPPMLECEGDYETEPGTSRLMGMPELVFTAKDPDAEDPCYAFVGPRNATAGWNAFTLEYPEGMEFHIMPMYFIGEHTLDDVLQSFAAEEEPAWAVPSGAVGGVTPGQSGTVAIDLQEGNYMFFCPIGGHMFQGMMGVLEVSAAANGTTPAPEPVADVNVSLVDYNFTMPTNVSANATVIKVTNAGTEPHEAPLVILDNGTTALQFLAAIESETPTGPPPGALIGGVNAIAPGQTVYLIVSLQSGRTYAMACFVESPTHGGAAHLELGMVKEFVAA